MNPSHLHLIVNHMPIAFAVLTAFVALVALIGKNASIKKLFLGLMFVTAVATTCAFFTGRAADIYDDSSDTGKRVQRHAAMAQTTWIFSLVSGVVGLGGLVVSRRLQEVPAMVFLVCTGLHLVCLFLFMKTTNLGGQIMHPETRSDALTKFLNPGS